MLTISLEKLKFYAGHGVYREESITGQEFLVDVCVTIDEPEQINDLAQTIDYEKLYHIIKEEMNRPAKLLEAIAQFCIIRIKETFVQAKSVEISIHKLHPPMGGEIGQSSIRIIKYFN